MREVIDYGGLRRNLVENPSKAAQKTAMNSGMGKTI
jgi:hypothetical protein